MSQCDQILAHLERASITPAEAYSLYRCFRLAARIKDLKERGHQIVTATENKNGKRFARYILLRRKK